MGFPSLERCAMDGKKYVFCFICWTWFHYHSQYCVQIKTIERCFVYKKTVIFSKENMRSAFCFHMTNRKLSAYSVRKTKFDYKDGNMLTMSKLIVASLKWINGKLYNCKLCSFVIIIFVGKIPFSWSWVHTDREGTSWSLLLRRVFKSAAVSTGDTDGRFLTHSANIFAKQNTRLYCICVTLL